MKKELPNTAEWETNEIQNGITEADAGYFASEQELEELDEKWNYNRKQNKK